MKLVNKKFILRGLLIIVCGYLVLIGSLYVFQDRLVFQTEKLPKDYRFKFNQPFTEIKIIPRIGHELSGLVFTPASEAPKGTIIYFHGNADSMQRWGNYASDFTKLGYIVLMIDYSGYGKSAGSASIESLYQDAEDTWEWVQRHMPSRNLIIYGRSLGAAVASHLATSHQPAQLILETPFDSIVQDHLKIFFPFGINNNFQNIENIRNIECPITILQGTDDWVVLFKSANKLVPYLKDKDEFIPIDKGGHKNLRDFDSYHLALQRILQ